MGLGIEVQNLYVKIYYTENKIRKRYSVGIKLQSNDQITDKGKLKSIVPDRERKQVLLDSEFNKLKKICDDYRREFDKDISVKDLDDRYKSNYTSEIKTEFVLDHYYVYYRLIDKEFKSNTKRSKDSIKEYKGLKMYLEDYEVKLGRKITLTEISEDWMIDFRNFNLQQRESTSDKVYQTNGGLRGNTLKKKINLFITFMRWLDKKKIHIFPSEIHGFASTIEQPEIVKDILTRDEVISLYNLHLEDPKKEFIRDVLIFVCNTGLRWSDLELLSKRDIKTNSKGDKYIQKKAKKTNDEYYVFLNDVAFDILKRYNFQLNLYTNANFNKYLKLLLKETGWFNQETDFEELNKETGKKRYKLRFEVISIHRGRDTFINLLLDDKVPINVIMRYTGHKSLSSLMKYIDLRKAPENYLKGIV
jgi:integrase